MPNPKPSIMQPIGSRSWVVKEQGFSRESEPDMIFGAACFPRRQFVQTTLGIGETTDDLVQAMQLFAQDVSTRVDTDFRVSVLEKVVLELRHVVNELTTARTIQVPIISFAPEPYSLKRPIIAIVQPDWDQFIATFFDASITATGDTQNEAVDNLKEVLLNAFRRFRELGEDRLGPGPRKQYAVLKSLILSQE
jgi:hypothetical protein